MSQVIQRKPSRLFRPLALALILAHSTALAASPTTLPSNALPTGGLAVPGQATISVSGATLNVKVSGTATPGMDFDQLTVSDAASLGGTLAQEAAQRAFQIKGKIAAAAPKAAAIQPVITQPAAVTPAAPVSK